MKLGHLLTRSGVTNPEVSSKVFLDSFCSWEILFHYLSNLIRGILFTCCIQFFLYSSILSKIGVIFNSFAICVFVLQSAQVYPAVLHICFISAAVILLATLALIVHVSLPYNETGRASVLYNVILVFLRVFYGLNILFIIAVIFNYLCNLLSMSNSLDIYNKYRTHM
jgi:hypothetical protein